MSILYTPSCCTTGMYVSIVWQPAIDVAASASAIPRSTRGKRSEAAVTMRIAMGFTEANGYYSCGRPLDLAPRGRLDMNTPHDLKSAGLKATLPRLKIINLFETSKVRHLTAEDVYRKLLDEGLDIGLATVYRVLTQFEQAGLLIRHHFESGKAVFELNEGHHHDHLVCLQCGRVEEFYDAGIEKRQTAVARERGFRISEHALYLYAECVKPRCPYRKTGNQ